MYELNNPKQNNYPKIRLPEIFFFRRLWIIDPDTTLHSLLTPGDWFSDFIISVNKSFSKKFE